MPDDVVEQNHEVTSSSQINSDKNKWADFEDVLNWTWRPCTHPGPCDNGSDCECFKSNLLCQRSCTCSVSCPLRSQGCSCPTELCSNIYGDEDKELCDCAANMWECSAELCSHPPKPSSKRRTKAQHKAHDCNNMALQQADYAYLLVQSGTHGLGLYAAENISAGTFVGEYIAEVFDVEGEDRDFLSNYSHLNYNFELNSTQALDSISVGNETRFINHHTDKQNVHAETKIVNGIARIIFSADTTIKKGKELFWDYGEKYWIDQAPIIS